KRGQNAGRLALPFGVPFDRSRPEMNIRLIVVALALFASCALGPAVSAAAQAKPKESSPAAVIKSLYKLHNNGNGPIFTRAGKKVLPRYFDSRLAALIWKNVSGTPAREVGNLDFDPFYNAQDTRITSF